MQMPEKCEIIAFCEPTSVSYFKFNLKSSGFNGHIISSNPFHCGALDLVIKLIIIRITMFSWVVIFNFIDFTCFLSRSKNFKISNVYLLQQYKDCNSN